MVYHPDWADFRAVGCPGTVIPVRRELAAEGETPVSLFRKVVQGPPCFLLESAEQGEWWGRYSFMGGGPCLTWYGKGNRHELTGPRGETRLAEGDPFSILRGLLHRYRPHKPTGFPPFSGGAVGYLAYDTVRHLERLPGGGRDDLGLPDCAFLLPGVVVVFDHLAQRIQVIASAFIDDDPRRAYGEAVEAIEGVVSRWKERQGLGEGASVMPAGTGAPDGPRRGIDPVSFNMQPDEFRRKVAHARRCILAGEAFQVVLSQRLSTPLRAEPFVLYRILRGVNPSPYMFYLDFGGFQLIGSSPEMLVRVEGNVVETRPIAGTRPRGRTPAEDEALVEELLADRKERAEHVMLVDLARNDLGRVSSFGSVQVTRFMEVGRFSHVMHLVSSVTGLLRPGTDGLAALTASFPAGTVTGAPKVRAMELIDELEPTRRGPYAGAVGYFDYAGDLDTGITIRTMVVSGGRCHVQAGAGIVADSDPDREYAETLNKARALLQTMEMGHQGRGAGDRAAERGYA